MYYYINKKIKEMKEGDIKSIKEGLNNHITDTNKKIDKLDRKIEKMDSKIDGNFKHLNIRLDHFFSFNRQQSVSKEKTQKEGFK